MKVALLYYYDPAQTGPADGEVPAWMDFDSAVKEAGLYVYEAGFHSATTARTISIRNNDVTTEDGGVVSAGEVLAGFYILDAPDMEVATQWAQRLPTATYGKVEVRPIVEFEA
jgi:hypothetical protein